MSLNRPRDHGNTPNFIHIDVEISKKRGTEVSFSYNLLTITLNESQGQRNWYDTIQFSDIYHHIKIEKNQAVNVSMQANVKVGCHLASLLTLNQAFKGTVTKTGIKL